MNLLRGILSIGIIIACMLNWVDIETEKLMFSVSGLTWVPSTILLYVSVFTAGYAFYNSYRSSNQNAWIYLTSGLYGSGVSVFIYLSVIGNFDLIYTFGPSRATDELSYNFGLGLYLTGLFSFLLFLTGFDKSDNKGPATTFDQQHAYMRQHNNFQSKGQEKVDKPNLQDWLKENPGKSINDYFSKFK
jgi:hypothetical protein